MRRADRRREESAEAAQTAGVATSDPDATPEARVVYANLHAFHMGSVDPLDHRVDVVAFDRYDFGDGRFARGYEADLRTVDAFARALTHRERSDVVQRTLLERLKTPGRKIAYVALWRNAPWEKFVPEPNDGAIADDFATMASDDAALLGGVHELYRPLHRQWLSQTSVVQPSAADVSSRHLSLPAKHASMHAQSSGLHLPTHVGTPSHAGSVLRARACSLHFAA